MQRIKTRFFITLTRINRPLQSDRRLRPVAFWRKPPGSCDSPARDWDSVTVRRPGTSRACGLVLRQQNCARFVAWAGALRHAASESEEGRVDMADFAYMLMRI